MSVKDNQEIFTLEKARVYERLTLVENKIELLIERFDRHSQNQKDAIDSMRSIVCEIGTSITGTAKEAGISERLRSVEKLINHVRVITVAVIIGAIKTAFDFFSGRH